MKRKELWMGAAIGATIATFFVLLTGPGDSALAQRPVIHGDSDSTVVVNLTAAGGGQFVVVVDTTHHVMGSYHIDAESGNISLKSIRNYQWDLSLEDFNGAEPKPQEVREMIQNR